MIESNADKILMTIASERSRAALQTRDFLEALVMSHCLNSYVEMRNFCFAISQPETI